MQNRIDKAPDWTHLRAFLATAEAGSLSAAARQLGLTQPTLSRQVAALEDALGLALFERTGRSMSLTDAGREMMRDARAMGEAAGRIGLLAEGRAHALEGQIKVTASDMTSAYLLPDLLVRLRSMAPRLRIDLIAANDIRDILAREADIAVRHVRPTEPDLIARLVRDAPAHLYASQSYVEARGLPQVPGDLAGHDFISLGDDTRMREGLRAFGVPVEGIQMRAGSTSGIAAWEMMRKGLGIFPMSDEIAEQFPDAVRLLDGQVDITFPIWLVTHRDLHTSRRIRLVFDLLAEMTGAG